MSGDRDSDTVEDDFLGESELVEPAFDGPRVEVDACLVRELSRLPETEGVPGLDIEGAGADESRVKEGKSGDDRAVSCCKRELLGVVSGRGSPNSAGARPRVAPAFAPAFASAGGAFHLCYECGGSSSSDGLRGATGVYDEEMLQVRSKSTATRRSEVVHAADRYLLSRLERGHTCGWQAKASQHRIP